MFKKILSRRGFTIVEVLVAFVIFSIMAAMIAMILNTTMRTRQGNIDLENEIAELFGVDIDCINLDFHGKFYRIDKETPFCKAPMGENVTIVKKTEGGAENG